MSYFEVYYKFYLLKSLIININRAQIMQNKSDNEEQPNKSLTKVNASKQNLKPETEHLRVDQSKATTSNIPAKIGISPAPEEPPAEPKKKCWSYIYNKEKKEFLGRTCKSWVLIISYAIMYLIFLTTYMLLFLFGSLSLIKYTEDYFNIIDKVELFAYDDNGIGLTVVPSENNSPLIWYRSDKEDEYNKYVKALDSLLNTDRNNTSRNKRDVGNLGPCGTSPYGYGDKPCVIIRINKQIGWTAKPLDAKSANAVKAPLEVRNWLKLKHQKLWLHCRGSYPWDEEHIGVIKYYPYPPGFDPTSFPLNMSSPSPLVAVQFINFTLGLSLSVQCQLWYANGQSSLEFVLYVARPKMF